MGKLDRLSGVKVAITGGGRGIGRSTAAAFRAAGARVVIGDIDASLATRTAEELGGLGLPLDVTDPVSFREFWQAAEGDGEPIRVLVNNAGIMPVGRFVDEVESATDRQLAVNLGGVINGCRLAGRHLPLAGGGAIVNIASLAGATGFPGVATYSATKFAVVGLSAALRAEFEPLDVSVHVVLPGVVRTELSAGMRLPAALRGFVSVSPDDVADAVVAAVRRDQFRRTVPRRLGVVLRVADLVPDGARRRLERWTGYDDVLVGADPAVRAAYERRISGDDTSILDL
ncbi:SDR family NAD(P)-dependent oxidoreductase [Nocardioides pelophilus]|uniref:SDR family NAD(P)-dependent oxidoreductase n=1 Tax=Nocardioides pelophilus TaxID=2172019 RepID=UPI001C825DB8|nr:SDR family NAD(P)-dependent oxidoreductase [Nocardioides pelophilus]